MSLPERNIVDAIDMEARHLKMVRAVLARHLPLKQVWAYGSRVKWSAKQNSDLDCVVFGADDRELMYARDAFDESAIPFIVQILSWESIPAEFKDNIKQEYYILQTGGDWPEVELGEVCAIKTGKKDVNHSTEDGGYPFFTCAATVSKSPDYDFDEEAILLPGNGANVGMVFYFKGKFQLYQRTYVLFNFKNILAKFLKYYLSANWKNYIQHRQFGSATNYIVLGDIQKFKIPLPPLAEQKAIADVLSSFDDKIELLNRQNETLEATAQAHFQKWFIADADPAWQTKPLDEIADYLNGLACQKYPPENEVDKLPVLKIRELKQGVGDSSDWVSDKVDEKYIVELGDVVFSWSGSLTVKIWNGERCVLNQHLFKITSEVYPRWFYYLWTKRYLEEFVGIAESKSTTMGHIKRDDLSNAMALVPPIKEMAEMSKTMDALFEKLILNFKSVRALERMRDDLLPKLMSGSVKIA